jgi:ferredoxin
MRVSIDMDRCSGHQMCAIAAPEVFGSDDEGFAVVLIDGELPTEQEPRARRAAGNCPERAVLIAE